MEYHCPQHFCVYINSVIPGWGAGKEGSLLRWDSEVAAEKRGRGVTQGPVREAGNQGGGRQTKTRCRRAVLTESKRNKGTNQWLILQKGCIAPSSLGIAPVDVTRPSPVLCRWCVLVLAHCLRAYIGPSPPFQSRTPPCQARYEHRVRPSQPTEQSS